MRRSPKGSRQSRFSISHQTKKSKNSGFDLESLLNMTFARRLRVTTLSLILHDSTWNMNNRSWVLFACFSDRRCFAPTGWSSKDAKYGRGRFGHPSENREGHRCKAALAQLQLGLQDKGHWENNKLFSGEKTQIYCKYVVYGSFAGAAMHHVADSLRLMALAKVVRLHITNQWALQRWAHLIQVDRSKAVWASDRREPDKPVGWSF